MGHGVLVQATSGSAPHMEQILRPGDETSYSKAQPLGLESCGTGIR